MKGLLLISALLWCGSSSLVTDEPDAPLEVFNTDLYKAIATQQPNENVFFSAVGVYTVLSLIYAGADGPTKAALSTALHAQTKGPEVLGDEYDTLITSLNQVQNVTLHVANKIGVMSGYRLQEEYQKLMEGKYKAEIGNSLRFGKDPQGAARSINSWVSEQTKGKISELFEPTDFDSDTRLVLVNAVYFKGNWRRTFDRKLTKTEPFRVNGDAEKIDVQMMHSKGIFAYKQDDGLEASVVRLPFNGDQMTMTIVLPTDVNGIEKVEQNVLKQGISSLLRGQMNRAVKVALPRFKVDTKMDLARPLTEMGLGLLFDGAKCNLTKMIQGEDSLHVSKAIQKALIEVNEEGAEAAAATGAAIKTKAALLHYEKFYVDHPFLVLLQKGDVTLFYGKIMRPISGQS